MQCQDKVACAISDADSKAQAQPSGHALLSASLIALLLIAQQLTLPGADSNAEHVVLFMKSIGS